MSILIERPGIFTTVQDTGRTGYRRFGVNPGGAMDLAAIRLINTVVGNREDDAVLEMHFPAAQIVFEKEMSAIVGGGEFGPILDGKAVTTWEVFTAAQGSVLKFSKKSLGNRAYLAVGGGFKADVWLGSQSTNLVACRGGLGGRRIEAGDRLEAAPVSVIGKPGNRISPWVVPQYGPSSAIRILPGAEFDALTRDGRDALLTNTFEISAASDRMGFRLRSMPIGLSRQIELISSAVSFGTVQALPDGQLIVLMADHQTTGGYPRLAHVIGRDLPVLAQLGPGDIFTFRLTTQDEAEALEIEFARDLKFLRVGSRFEAVTSQ